MRNTVFLLRQLASYSMWPVPLTTNGLAGYRDRELRRMSSWQTRLKKYIHKAQIKATGGSMTICAMIMVSMSMTRECCGSAGPEIYTLR